MMGLPTGNLGIPNIMGIIPGMTAFASWFMKSKMKALGVPPVREYLEMLSDGGAKLYACKLTADLFGMKMDDFVEGVDSIVTASDFIDMTEGAQIIWVCFISVETVPKVGKKRLNFLIKTFGTFLLQLI
ncbi:MAG: DsrE/DsrF/DrsH-like family protein [Anaerolineales bacterium]|nr:DsrE/DsrF/DrsH-like family protein [Anaerolineales bacterium]